MKTCEYSVEWTAQIAASRPAAALPAQPEAVAEESSRMSRDALSDALQSVRPRGWMGAERRLAVPLDLLGDSAAAAFYFVIQGECRLDVPTASSSQRLLVGDLAVVAGGRSHSLRDDSALGRSANEPLNGAAARLLCGGIEFTRDPGSLLPDLLPPCVVVRGEHGGRATPWLADALRWAAHEAAARQPGGQALVDHLVQVLYIQSVRAALAALPNADACRLGPLLDPDIGPALRVMHDDPHLPWTVASLADRVGMSRSSFAARFKTLVAKSPLQYLAEYRMARARALLDEGQCGLKQIAAQVGYATRGAFSNAFKRWCGASPGAYRRTHHGVAARPAPV